MRYLVTGSAGFIGAAVSNALLTMGHEVIGLDSLNSYYDPKLKHARLEQTRALAGDFTFVQLDLCDLDPSDARITSSIDVVIHLAAQAGVRYSIEQPQSYVRSNLVGFANLLEMIRHNEIPHTVYASSSSVYGANRARPFGVDDAVNQPVSFYAATKRANELMAQSYSSLYGIPMTGLRFFTAYGPWGRPDMAYFSFTNKILRGEPIRVFGQGKLSRDFTYIDDIVDGVLKCAAKAPTPGPYRGPGINESTAPHRVFNLGNGAPVTVDSMIDELESALGKAAIRDYIDRQLGDVDHTLSDISSTTQWCGYTPTTPLAAGIPRFVDWYVRCYGNNSAAAEVQ